MVKKTKNDWWEGGGEGACGGEDPAVYASAVVQQESHRHLELLGLFGGG